MNSNGDILIVEPAHGGHRVNHVGIIARHLRSKGIEPKLLTSLQSRDAGGFDQLNVSISCFDEGPEKSLPFHLRFLPKHLRWQFTVFRQISRHLKTIGNKTKCAIFPTLQASGLLPAGMDHEGFPVPWVGIVMAPGPHLRSYKIKTHHSAVELWVQRKAYRGLTKQSNCLCIGSFDPLFVEWMDDRKVVYCPDPVRIASTDEDHSLVSETTKPVILVAGSIDKRKRVCELAELLAEVNRVTPLHLVIAGNPNEEIRAQLKDSSAVKSLQQTNSIDLILRRLSDCEMDHLFQRADIVWSGNLRAYGSSGAVVRAGMHGKPVVTMRNSVLGNWMDSVGGGPVADLSSPTELQEIFKRLAGETAYRESLGRQNFQLFGKNTEQRYCEVLLGSIGLSENSSEPDCAHN